MFNQSKLKKSVFLGCLLTSMTMVTSMNAQAKTVSGFKIYNCHEDYEKVNFCSAKFVKYYKKALRKGSNFNHHYALTFIPSGYGFSEVVAINTKKKFVIPLGVEIKPKGKVSFSKKNAALCFRGDISGYRQDNSYKKVCYQLEKNPYQTNPKYSNMNFSRTVTEF